MSRLTFLASQNVKAGEYTTEVILRWHRGLPLRLHLSSYFSGLSSFKSDAEFAEFLSKQEEAYPKEEMLPFLALMRKIIANKAIPTSHLQLE